MPQLDVAAYLPQVFWVVIRFFILYVCVARGILPLMGRILWVRELKRTRASTQLDLATRVAEGLETHREALVRTKTPGFVGLVEERLAQGKAKETQDLNRVWGLFN